MFRKDKTNPGYTTITITNETYTKLKLLSDKKENDFSQMLEELMEGETITL